MAKKTKTLTTDEVFDKICAATLKSINSFCPCICKCNKIEDAKKRKDAKKQCIFKLQKSISDELCKTTNQNWQIEYVKPHAAEQDQVDIYCQSKTRHWVIEIDTTRADQVGKKAFSRFALYGTGEDSIPFFYVAIIYPGTDSMNLNEVIKYSRYGHTIAKKMDIKNEFRTIVIDCKDPCIKILRFDQQPKFTVNGENEQYTMPQAVKKAVELYLNKNGNSLDKLIKMLENDKDVKNHNGQQMIVSKSELKKNPIEMSYNEKSFYLTTQWMYYGKNANFDEIIRFFNNHKIFIQHVMEVRKLN